MEQDSSQGFILELPAQSKQSFISGPLSDVQDGSEFFSRDKGSRVLSRICFGRFSYVIRDGHFWDARRGKKNILQRAKELRAWYQCFILLFRLHLRSCNIYYLVELLRSVVSSLYQFRVVIIQVCKFLI